MENYKKIIFTFAPGYFENKVYIRLVFTKLSVTYQHHKINHLIFEEEKDKPSRKWRTKISDEDYIYLCYLTEKALNTNTIDMCDAPSITISVITEDGKLKENSLDGSFDAYNLEKLNNFIMSYIDDTMIIPSFLVIKKEEETNSNLLFQLKLKKLLKSYGAQDIEIENFMNDLYKEDNKTNIKN